MSLEIKFTRGNDSGDLFDRLRNLEFGELQARYIKKDFHFLQPAATSRGIMRSRSSYFLIINEKNEEGFTGIGECAPLEGLSPEFGKAFENKLTELCNNINRFPEYISGALEGFSALQFGLETALLDLDGFGSKILFPSQFTEGKEAILYNGLIWMSDPEEMVRQINRKLEEGFGTLKLKVGNNSLEDELQILEQIRANFDPYELEIRLDANGAFRPKNALTILEQYAAHDIHSIEQPIAEGDWEEMAELCRESPVPIALDEELIGVVDYSQKIELMESILPAYIILKPTLCGGLQGAEEWIAIAEDYNVQWWATSALESNLGLSAISQWVYTLKNPLPQGLGTGQLFQKNFTTPLYSQADQMFFDPGVKWDLSYLFQIED